MFISLVWGFLARGVFVQGVFVLIPFTSRPHGLGPFTTRVSTLAMERGNVFNLQEFQQNKIPFKQRSFEDSIGTFMSLFDADLLLIWMNTFQHGFHFRHASC